MERKRNGNGMAEEGRQAKARHRKGWGRKRMHRKGKKDKAREEDKGRKLT